MPTLSSGINLALQAVLAHAQAIEIIEHNVANANTPGYRRQSAVLAATAPAPLYGMDHGVGSGMRGTGVTVESIQRFNLQFFDGRFRSVSAEASRWDAQRDVLQQLEAALAETSSDGLIPGMDRFWSAWQNLADDPTNMSLRIGLLDDAQGLVQGLHRRWEQLNTLRSDQNLAVIDQVEEINTLSQEVARLNGEISRVLSVGEQPNDLLDKRDMVLDRLSEISGAVSYPQKNGEVMVAINGHVLVTGHDALKLSTQRDPVDSAVVRIFWEDGQVFGPQSGSLKGLLEVRDQILPTQMAGLDQLANGLITQVNAIHSLGYGLQNPPVNGIPFFTGTTAETIRVNPALDAASIATASAAGQAGNSDIAARLAALKDFKGMAGGTMTLNGLYNSQVTGLGLLTQKAQEGAYNHGLVQKALSDQRESVGGVSLDEEAANLAKYQRAYQAAARVLTAYDEMLNTVINNMGLVGR